MGNRAKKPRTGILQIEGKGVESLGPLCIVLSGRTLAIIEELAEMQEEINRASPKKSQIEIYCKGEEHDVGISIKTWKT